MKRRSFFGALLGAAAVPLVKAKAEPELKVEAPRAYVPTGPMPRLTVTGGKYGDLFRCHQCGQLTDMPPEWCIGCRGKVGF